MAVLPRRHHVWEIKRAQKSFSFPGKSENEFAQKFHMMTGHYLDLGMVFVTGWSKFPTRHDQSGALPSSG